MQMCRHDYGYYLFRYIFMPIYVGLQWCANGYGSACSDPCAHMYTRINLSMCIHTYAKSSVRSCMQPCAHEVDMVCIHVCNDISVYKCVFQCSDNLGIHACLGEYACVSSLNSQGSGSRRGPACTCLCASTCVHKGLSMEGAGLWRPEGSRLQRRI